MPRIVTEPVRTARGDLEMAAHKVATFAKTHPGQWGSSDIRWGHGVSLPAAVQLDDPVHGLGATVR